MNDIPRGIPSGFASGLAVVLAAEAAFNYQSNFELALIGIGLAAVLALLAIAWK